MRKKRRHGNSLVGCLNEIVRLSINQIMKKDVFHIICALVLATNLGIQGVENLCSLFAKPQITKAPVLRAPSLKSESP